MTSTRFANEVTVGSDMGKSPRRPSNAQLFRYCATTWNGHRIHYDKDYAASEGYPNVLVQSHLHGAFLTSFCTDWMGERGRLARLEYSVRRFACPGDVLVCQGEVTAVTPSEAPGFVEVTVALREVRESDDVTCALGEATITLPVRA
jgi:hydroxyacyl-ACP dehydratase HTD2-like protein with hotdog domain